MPHGLWLPEMPSWGHQGEIETLTRQPRASSLMRPSQRDVQDTTDRGSPQCSAMCAATMLQASAAAAGRVVAVWCASRCGSAPPPGACTQTRARSPSGARARVGTRRAPRDTCWLSRRARRRHLTPMPTNQPVEAAAEELLAWHNGILLQDSRAPPPAIEGRRSRRKKETTVPYVLLYVLLGV